MVICCDYDRGVLTSEFNCLWHVRETQQSTVASSPSFFINFHGWGDIVLLLPGNNCHLIEQQKKKKKGFHIYIHKQYIKDWLLVSCCTVCSTTLSSLTELLKKIMQPFNFMVILNGNTCTIWHSTIQRHLKTAALRNDHKVEAASTQTPNFITFLGYRTVVLDCITLAWVYLINCHLSVFTYSKLLFHHDLKGQ